MKRILGAALAGLGLITLGVPAAHAAPVTLPQCETIISINCQGTFTNVYRGDGLFAQTVNGTLRAESYWPFRNPTVAGYLGYGDPDAFPSDYLTLRATTSAQEARVAELSAVVGKQASRIERQRRIIRHLRHRLGR